MAYLLRSTIGSPSAEFVSQSPPRTLRGIGSVGFLASLHQLSDNEECDPFGQQGSPVREPGLLDWVCEAVLTCEFSKLAVRNDEHPPIQAGKGPQPIPWR